MAVQPCEGELMYPVELVQAALYNEMHDESGKIIDPKILAPLIGLYFLTPKESREAYARELLKMNPAIRFIAYVLFNTADLSTTDTYGNQPYAPGQAIELQNRYPDIAMLDNFRKPIRKGIDRPAWLMDFRHKQHRDVLQAWMKKVIARAPFFEYIGFDDYSTRAYNYPDGEYASLNLGTSRSEEYWKAFLDNAEFNRSWIEAMGLGHAANMNSPIDKAMIDRFVSSMPLIAAPMNGKKSIIMLEYFMTDWDGNNNRDNAVTSITRAKAVKDAGGEVLATLQINPFEVNRQRATNGPRYRQFMYNLLGLLLVADGRDYVRVAKSYKDFADLPEIRDVPKQLGAALDKSFTVSNGVYRRRFENGTVVVDTNKHEGRIDPAEPDTVPDTNEIVREGLTLLSGARYVNLRTEAKSDAPKLGEVWSGMRVKQFRELVVSDGLTWARLEVLSNGNWIKGYAAVFGEDEKGGWFLTVVPDIREI
jgi:hypothetical protein